MNVTSLQARLFFAVVLGDTEAVRHLLASGAKPVDASYDQPLVVTAMRQGNFVTAQLLIGAGTDEEPVVLSEYVSQNGLWTITTSHKGIVSQHGYQYEIRPQRTRCFDASQILGNGGS